MSQVILGLGKHVEVMLRSSFLISYHLTQYSTRKARPEVDQAMGLRREKKQKNEFKWEKEDWVWWKAKGCLWKGRASRMIVLFSFSK